MQQLTILNSRAVKKIREIVIKQFGYFLEGDYAFLQNEKERVFIINKDLAKVETKNLRIDRIGLYFAEVKENQVRLSKEGAQLLAEEAKKNNQQLKNVISLDHDQVKKYFTGENLDQDLGEENRFVLLQYENDIFGCAKYKNKVILNFLPKIHRGEVII